MKIGRCRLLLLAPLAQLVEQLTLNQWVLGSSPRWCTTKQPYGKRKAVFLMIAALWSAFVLPLTWVEVSGSFCFAGKIQELLL